jgi:hypothetical protein
VAEPGVFEAFYASALQHPLLLWLAAAAGLAIGLAQRDRHASVRRYVIVLAVLSALDAWLTSTHIYGIGALPGALASAVPVFFVIAGDARYLLVVEAATARGELEVAPRAFARALGLALIVPIAAFAITALFVPGQARILYLTHELLFCTLTLVLLRWHPNAALPWVRKVSHFVLVYYGLWAAADVILLATRADIGFALRVVPNVLYYGGLIAAISRFAPPPTAR